VAPAGREPDTPGWEVRVVPNLYPALERQEVVVHTPRHARSLAELEEREVQTVASALYTRREAARAEGFPYVQVVLNEGRVAGSSLPHSHSQLFWLREPPPAVQEELPRLEQGQCGVCEVLREDGLEIALRGEVTVIASPAGRAPYELVIAPRQHAAEPTEPDLVDAALLLHDAIRRLRDVEGPVPLNAWLHTGGHWHLELVPRLTVFAGLELGAGIYVNSLSPEEAAQRLRT
jgi:UDPglucose--hexose-1-phosphate uridylyltransferase